MIFVMLREGESHMMPTTVKKITATVLTMLILVTSLAIPAHAQQRARVLRAVGDGLRYYIEYEYDGAVYRTDTMGARFNQLVWEHFSDEDKSTIASTYAFSPRSRKAQFGEAGSNTIVTWVNDVTGWTEAGEIWKNRIAARDFPDLTAYYTADPSILAVNGRTLGIIESEVVSLGYMSPEIKSSQQYRAVMDEIQHIKSEFLVGKSAYRTLVDIRARQIGNAFKAGSAQLIPVIVDGFIVGHVTRGASVVSEFVATSYNFIKQCVDTAISEAESADGSVQVVLEQMWQAILKLEELATSVQSRIDARLVDLVQLRQVLDAYVEQFEQAVEAKEQQSEAVAQIQADRVDEPVTPASYTFTSSAEDEAERLAEIRNQIMAEANQLRSEYDAILVTIDNGIDALLSDLGAGWITPYEGHSYYNKYKGVVVSTTFAMPDGEVVDVTEYLHPHYVSSHLDYSFYKGALAQQSADIISRLQQSHDKLVACYTGAMALATSTTEAYKQLQPRVEGLTAQYRQHIGGSVEEYVYRHRHPETELRSVVEVGYLSYPTYSEADFAEHFTAQIDLIDAVNERFYAQAQVFESDIVSLMAPYNSLKANLVNAASHLLGSVSQLKTLQQESPYVDFSYGWSDAPQIDLPAIYHQINQKPTQEEKDAERQRIIDDLVEFRDLEYDLAHKISVAKGHVQYYQNQISRLLSEIGFNETDTQMQNLSQILGYEVLSVQGVLLEVSTDFWSVYHDFHDTTDVTYAISALRGHTDEYYDIMFLRRRINSEGNSWLSMPQQQFDTKIASYRADLDNLRNAGLASSNQFQWENINSEYWYATDMLLTLEYQYGMVPVTGVSIVDRFSSAVVESLTLEQFQTYALDALVEPAHAFNPVVFWSSSNPNVVSVDDTGVLWALDEGVATVTVTTEDGGLSAQCVVSVSSSAWPVHVTYLDKQSVHLTPGNSEKITAWQRWEWGPEPEDINEWPMENEGDYPRVGWDTSDTSVATVTQNGIVTAVAAGSAIITAVDLFTDEIIGTAAVIVSSPTQNPYDLNGDGQVDFSDLAILSLGYGMRTGQPGWNAAHDLNGDGVIDVFDFVLLVIMMTP